MCSDNPVVLTVQQDTREQGRVPEQGSDQLRVRLFGSTESPSDHVASLIEQLKPAIARPLPSVGFSANPNNEVACFECPLLRS